MFWEKKTPNVEASESRLEGDKKQGNMTTIFWEKKTPNVEASYFRFAGDKKQVMRGAVMKVHVCGKALFKYLFNSTVNTLIQFEESCFEFSKNNMR
ncbi:hypothetical protein KP509_15G075600 [Ceratopteris richardii]|uniref:Uncharacterized protein n=1 Tax=Ceratopteris richardii TaxID=49495 RepID=A0A8T2TBC7_CERRI|nr:hypothetical protein KP509_15G075600 [Ceratopteris richardii]